MEPPCVVVEPEQQRADLVLAALVPAKAGDHAVGGARVLDLEHRALAGLVEQSRHASRSRRRARRPRSGRASRAPSARSRVSGVRWTGGWTRASACSRRRRRSICGASRRSRAVDREQIEGDERRRRAPSPASPPARRRDGGAAAARRSRARAASAITISPSTTHASGRRSSSSVVQLREVAIERPRVAALDVDLVGPPRKTMARKPSHLGS